MAQITEKELSFLSDLLSAEQVCAAKYRAFAEDTDDAALKDCYNGLAQRHSEHFEQLYTNLK